MPFYDDVCVLAVTIHVPKGDSCKFSSGGTCEWFVKYHDGYYCDFIWDECEQYQIINDEKCRPCKQASKCN